MVGLDSVLSCGEELPMFSISIFEVVKSSMVRNKKREIAHNEDEIKNNLVRGWFLINDFMIDNKGGQ